MHRTTIMLPEDLRRRALRKAHELGISLGEYVRNCMDKDLQHPKKGNEKKRDPLFDIKVWTGPAPRDGSTNVDKYLYDEVE